MNEPSSPLGSLQSRGAILIISVIFAGAWTALLAIAWIRHEWFVDAHGRPLPIDFLEVWVAGKSVWAHAPAAPYDWRLHHAMQVAAIGHPFQGYLGWHYPPLFLIVAAWLALLPYAVAVVVWMISTLGCLLVAVGRIAGRFEGALLAFASPPVLANLYSGQNGCFSAALIGGVLLCMESRPAVAGILLGLLSYKPQLGLLFPIALLANKRWRVLLFAALTSMCGILIPDLLLGTAPFHAFLHFLPQTGEAVLANGSAGWNKLQTVYGMARWLGGSNAVAWAMQLAAGLTIAGAIAFLWSRPGTSPSLKAAALAAGCVLVTPYLYFYDLPILAVSLAFLFKDRSFDPAEWVMVGVADVLFLSFMWQPAPVGPVIALLIAGTVARRLTLQRAHQKQAQPGGESVSFARERAAI